MPLGFSEVPRFWASVNVTLPTVNAASTAEKALTPATDFPATAKGQLGLHMMIKANPADPATDSQVALPSGLIVSHAYFHSDGKLYIRFANVTAVNYTSAEVVTFHIVGF